MSTDNKSEIPGGGKTLHEFVAKALSERIQNGEWPVGAALPSEHSFCRAYGVSRHTLRHALATLEQSGLILRRQGAPTRVISRESPRRFTQSVNSPEELLRYSTTTYRVHEVEEYVECDQEIQPLLQCELGSSWYHIGAVRRERGSNLILSYSDIYMLPRFAELVHEPDHTHCAIYELIERRFGVVVDRGEVNMSAAGASARVARSLQVPKHTPCLVIVRRYFDDQGTMFEATISYHPEGRFVYNMEYQSSRAASAK